VRASLAALLTALVALAGCGGEESASPEEVVRAWSRALNSGDNGAAADLFALGARIEQAGLVLTVRSREDAVAWNASLPCSGKIVSLRVEGDTAIATFTLFDRRTSLCDAPGGRATAVLTVRDGKIVRWRQTAGQAVPVEPV
jgi:limonene-1,2-epoxide hydrolase